MTTWEYFQAWRRPIVGAGSQVAIEAAGKELLKAFVQETISMIDPYSEHSVESFLQLKGIVSEQSLKWNQLSRLFKKYYGESYLEYNAFITHWHNFAKKKESTVII